MAKKIIVVGELHQDLYYESDFYEQLVEKIVSNLLNYVQNKPDDFNRKLLEKIVKKAFSETPKKIVGYCSLKRGGNGNNSSEYIANLGIPTKLITVIGRGSEWMISELKEHGINTNAIFQIDEITPVSTIIKSSFTTKIHVAPDLKNKMNFDSINVDNNVFEDAKIIFSTPIDEKFIKLFENGFHLGLITAFNIETQKIQKLEQLSQLLKEKYDIFFLNFEDANIILNKKLSVEEVDEIFKKYAQIRIYTAGKDGSHVLTDNFRLNFPGIKVEEIIDRTGAGDCYAAGFLTRLYELIENKTELKKLYKPTNSEKLKEILNKCLKFATYSAIYKITKQIAPTRNEMDKFIKSFKIN